MNDALSTGKKTGMSNAAAQKVIGDYFATKSKLSNVESAWQYCKDAERRREAAESRQRAKEEEDAAQAKEAKAREEFAATVAALLSEPTVFRVLASVKLCDEKADEKRALAEIQQEKANAKIAGVVSLSDLKDLQDEVVYSRKMQDAYRKGLADLKLQALPCSHKSTQRVIQCRETRQCDPDMVFVLGALEAIDLRNR